MESHQEILKASLIKIINRSLPKGGFSTYNGGPFRPDATAWAVLALEAGEVGRKLSEFACQRLSCCQNSDGRISVIEAYPRSYWPTSLAILAWTKTTGFEKENGRAIQFLLKNSGKHWAKKENSPAGHDTAIKGWPWIEDTHSWIEPTALAILALRAFGYDKHKRVSEAVKMILDRQLPSGGWNYGNKTVFNKELKPISECTGVALTVLEGLTERSIIELSINYLKKKIEILRTPLALSWTIFGLSAWSDRPVSYRDWIIESLTLQKKYGSYDTGLLSQLLVAYFADGDLLGLLNIKK